jgi:hypothetical protein
MADSGFATPRSLTHCNEPSARAVGRFTQDAEIAGPAQRFGGIVEGVVLAVGIGQRHDHRHFVSLIRIAERRG